MNSQTFRQRVVNFWEWFPAVAEELAPLLKSGTDISDAVAKFSEDVDEKLGGLSWVFGPGESDDRLSFTVTGEGQREKQLMSHYWLQFAVDLPGWDFYCSRQPSPREQLESLEIQVGETSVNTNDLQIACEVDEENKVVNISAWHEVFANIPEDGQYQILFLLLDEAVGEFGTQMQIGGIEVVPAANSIPLIELPEFLRQVWDKNDWQLLTPLEQYTTYRSPEPSDEFERADTIAGHTCVPNIMGEFLGNKGLLEENPLAGRGTELVYVKLDRAVLPEENELDARDKVEEALEAALAGLGYSVGAATGVAFSYLDLIIFDGEASLAAIQKAMSELQLDGHYEIKSFAD